MIRVSKNYWVNIDQMMDVCVDEKEMVITTVVQECFIVEEEYLDSVCAALNINPLDVRKLLNANDKQNEGPLL